MDFKEIMEVVTRAMELVGVTVIVVGFAVGALLALRDVSRGQRIGVYAMVRKYLGQSILLGVEILVAADLIRTVTIEPTLNSALTLGIIVLIRTLLSFSLDVEIYGRLPWRASKQAAAATETKSA